MKEKKKKRTWLRVIGIVVLFIVLGAGAYAYSIYKSLTNAAETMHHPIDRKMSEKRVEEITLEKQEPFSVLMLGVDEREDDRGRSDSIIVLTINSNQNSVKMLSIPRDTRTEIVGYGKEDKINHAYAFGGIEMAMATVENFLDIPIDYYIQINMEGFKDIVDAVGGITVNNDFDFSYGGVHFPKGEITLNGDKALLFSRMRHEDPRGDAGRQLRQRQIIQAIIKEGASLSSLTNYNQVFNALGNNIKTNLNFNEMVEIQKNYRAAAKKVDQISIEGKGTKIDRIYYLIVPDEEKQRVQDELKGHLEIK
ncbi:polyisoprenyl-teichoic acid--peptidoglycan teichoic acid transferase TagU [Cytobacillus dafuensis]|uniref:Polyisoprenyl-teichoic acid--peptidoglycan teichoic acid transferase TagU n=1 Tax=Cytobacillus dafuensis TaxID=1742359 RepID=A0A5B8ZBM2_CYTDA|nr:LytR family transcriptional regulator [Cytobacillus dafuensis]QED49663.1 LytR family transcriptional regulator [Cytobacillus dafuensis]